MASLTAVLNDNSNTCVRITLTTKQGADRQQEGLHSPDLEGREGSAWEARSLTHGTGVSLKSPNDHESLLLLTLVWRQVASAAFISEPSSYSHLKGQILLSSLCLHCPYGLSRGRGRVCLLGLSSARERG